MKKVGENKGITMIVLVVTIAIMLILAGVTISTVFGDEGLIKQSKELAKQTESSIEGDNNDVNSLINELNSLMQTQAGVGQKGITVWNNGKATIELEAINISDENYEIQWQKNGTAGTWTVGTTVTNLISGDKVYAKLVSDSYGELEAVINILDTIKPTITIEKAEKTANSISVTVSSRDLESGMPSSPTYTYCIKKSSDVLYGETIDTQKTTTTSTTCAFTGLLEGQSYDIKVTATDVAGNEGMATITNVITTGSSSGGGSSGGGAIYQGNVTAGEPVWNNGTCSIELITNPNLSIKYKVNTLSGDYKDYTGAISGLKHGAKIYAVATDGTNYGNVSTINVEDTKAPVIKEIQTEVTYGAKTTQGTKVTIKIDVIATDEETGIKEYEYYLSTGGEYALIDKNDLATASGSVLINAESITNNSVKVVVKDNAGNITTQHEMVK